MKSMKTRGTITGIMIGVSAAIAITLTATIILTFLLLGGKMSVSIMNPIGMITNSVAALVGCVITGKLVKEKLAIRIGVCAAVYLLTLVAINVLLFSGGLQNSWKGLLSVAIGYIGACAICLRNGKRKGFKKIAYR